MGLLVGLLALWLLSRRPAAPPEGGLAAPPEGGLAHGFIIHLDDRHDRDANVAALVREAAEAGVRLSVFAAVDGRGCPHESVAPPFLDFSFPPGHLRDHLRGGERGCLASFLRTFAEAARVAHRVGCFFLEDDAIVDRHGFARIVRALDQHRSDPIVFHGRRSVPGGWPDKHSLHASEAQNGRDSGWIETLAPNYSNAMFAVTNEGVRELRIWLDAIVKQRLARMPADDLLSVACGAHPGPARQPVAQHWSSAPAPRLRGWAPVEDVSSRMPSSSDTEPRAPRTGALCKLPPDALELAFAGGG